MSDPAIRIRVGAAVDRNIGNAFRPIVDAARDARRQVEDEMDRLWQSVNGGKSAGKAGQGPYRSVVREAERAAGQVLATERRKQDRIVAEAIRTQRRVEAEQRRVTKERERAEYQAQANVAKEWKRNQAAQQKENVGRLRAVGGGTVETLGKVGRGALGVAGSIARGAGVQTDLGSYIGQAVDIETRASELSAAAYDEQRDKGKRIDPRELVAIARNVGQEAAFDPAKVLEGLQAFVGKTGDLATGKAALPGLSKLARATGTSLEDMVGAAGEAAKALGDVGPGKDFETAADKGMALVNVLRLMAGQGKVGAAELKDMARYGGRLAAASQAFGGNAAQNLGDMGALAQLAIAQGGAASAAEAATSVAGFANTLKTPARVKEFKAHGVDVFAKGGGFKSVRDILKESSTAAVERGGENAPIEFKKMFANVKGGQAADPAFQAYQKAYRAALDTTKDKTKADMAGKAAIDELFDKFGKAIGENEEKESFDRSMKTGAAQVQLFNNKLSEIGAQIAERVLPQLQKLAPYVVSAAEAFAKMVSFAAENPGTAISAAIVASIGKAAIGAAVSGAVTKLIDAAGGKFSGKMNMALASAAITIAAATIVAQMITEKREAGAKGSAEQRESVKADIAAVSAKKELGQADVEKLKADRAIIQNQIKEGQRYFETGRERYGGEGVIDTIGGGFNQIMDVARGKTTFEDIGRGKEAEAKFPELLEQRAAIDRLIATIEKNSGKPIKAEITNLPGTPGPVANTANTTP